MAAHRVDLDLANLLKIYPPQNCEVVDDRASKPGPGPGRAFEARLKPGPGRASLKPVPGPGLLVNLPICTISDENIKIMSAKQT